MKAGSIILVLIGAMGIIIFIRGGRDFSLPQVLPFCGGHRPGFYDFGAVCLLALMLWGLGRLRGTGRQPPEEHEIVESTVEDDDADRASEAEDTDDESDQQQSP